MGSIEEALKAAGAEHDLHTILRVLEDKFVGFKRQEAAAGPFANMDTAMLTGLNIRMLSVKTRAQQQQQQQQQQHQRRFPSHHIGSLCSLFPCVVLLFTEHISKLIEVYQPRLWLVLIGVWT